MRKFSWKNFSIFLIINVVCICWLWLFWSVVDINLHNEKQNEKPSKYNAFVLFVQLVESEVK